MKSIDVDRAVDVINRQIDAIAAAQSALVEPTVTPSDGTPPPKKKRVAKASPMALSKMTSQVMTMARGLSAILAEMRKTAEEIDEKLKNLTPEREARLMLRLISRVSPEYRAAAALHIQQLDGKLISHTGGGA